MPSNQANYKLVGSAPGKPSSGHNHYQLLKGTPARREEHQCLCSCKMKVFSQNNIIGGYGGDGATTFFKKYVNIRYLGLLLFILASCYCVYRIVNPHEGDRTPPPVSFKSHLRLVSAFNRHGDRAPSDSLPAGDPHVQFTRLIWPNGMTNLTDLGRMRQYRIGLELRRRYLNHLDFDASSFAAFSSPIYRCQESLTETLRGLFSNEWPISVGLKLARAYSAAGCGAHNHNQSQPEPVCRAKAALPAGFSWPGEWKKIPIDTETFPMLTYEYLNKCKYRLDHPTPIDADLRLSRAISRLPGLDQLSSMLEAQYGMKLNFTSLGLWSTIANELRLIRSQETLDLASHVYDWVNRPVATNETTKTTKTTITLFDLYEQVAVFGYRDRIVGTSNYIQLGPLISSLLESQSAALARHEQPPTGNSSPSSPPSAGLYANKKMIFYSTHDSILQLLMHSLAIIDPREDSMSYERRFNKWQAADDLQQLLAGLRMSKYGMSLLLEFWEVEPEWRPEDSVKDATNTHGLAYLKAYLYNREEATGGMAPIDYRPLEMGAICRRLFQRLHNSTADQHFFSRFDQFKLSPRIHCPFEMFANVTSGYRVDAGQLSNLCD